VTPRAESEGRLAATLRANSQLARESADLRALSTALAAKVPSGPAASVPVASPSPPSRPSAPATASPVRASPTRARPAAAEKVAATATVNPAPPARTHRISPGETLASISRIHYGTTSRWSEIVAANRDVLPDQGSFTPGRILRIP
jgi:nucleoid-associated protein YgaU